MSSATFSQFSDAAIVNHTSIPVEYGGMEDFDSLVDAVHARGKVTCYSHMNHSTVIQRKLTCPKRTFENVYFQI